MADLSVTLFGKKFKNPVLPGAGPNVRDGALIAQCAEGGAGALLCKTISIKAAPVPRPHMAIYARSSMLNTELWSELPPETWFEKEYPAALAVAKKHGLPIGASMGYTASDLTTLGPKVEKMGFDWIECTIHYLEHSFDPVIESMSALRKAVKIPIVCKLSPHAGDLGDLAEKVEPYVDGFMCINSLGPGLSIDIEKVEPLMGSQYGYGWLSGEALRPIALRAVFEVARRVKKPVIGAGGVMHGKDLIEFFMCGASAVEICTEAIVRGNHIYGKVAQQASDWLDKHGYKSIQEIQGLYLKKYGHGQRVVVETEEPVVVDEAKCIACTQCERVCEYDAIKAPPKVKAWVIDNDCFQCGLCVTVCPTFALSFKPREKTTLVPAGASR